MKAQANLFRVFLLVLCALEAPRCNRTGTSAVPLTSGRVPPILLFNGTGSSPGDIAAIESLLEKNSLAWSTASSTELNAMSSSRLRTYQLIIIPGGDFTRIGTGLTRATTARLRESVRNGTNYLGICAGAFFAGRSPYNGLDLTSGVQFHFYSAESRGVRKTAVPISGPGMPTLEQYWEDGPELSGWGSVIGRYPDGKAAVVEGRSGKGWIILCGVHPEAPESWRRGMTFATPASADNEYFVALVRSALERRPLPEGGNRPGS